MGNEGKGGVEKNEKRRGGKGKETK